VSELVVLIGVPGSGKSSFVQHRYAATHVHVSKDLMKSARDKNERQRRLVGEALAQGRSVVVDNTNVTRADRAPLLQLARQHGARVIAFFFDAPPKECAARNALRSGAARVPAVAIWAAARKLQPPAADEGFDETWRVALGPSGFEVQPFTPQPLLPFG
jgi:predicted kinase